MRKYSHLIVGIIAFSLYASSLFSPAIVVGGLNEDGKIIYGAHVLLIGWLGFAASHPPFTQLAWYANIFFILGLASLLRSDYKSAMKMSIISLVLASNTLLWFFMPLDGDEGGVTRDYLKYLHIGFFLWVASMATIYLWSIRANRIIAYKLNNSLSQNAP